MNPKLTIGVDIRDLKVAKTGTQTYLYELCREFKLMKKQDVNFHFFDSTFPIYTGENKLLKLIEHARYQCWKQITLPIKAWFKGCNIVFCTDNYVPYFTFNFQTVPVFHDAFFFENPEHFNKYWLWVFKKLAVPAARNSPIVISPTQYAKAQIHKHTRIDLARLVVVYEGPKSLAKVPALGRSKSTNPLLDSVLKEGNYLLHVGVMNKRKNIPCLIHAFKKVKESGFPKLKLVLAGKFDAKPHSNDQQNIEQAIQESGYASDIILPGYLNNDDLSQVYAHALMYVFPSLNEGFGIPILEAWSYRLPVLVANNTCLPEVGGDAVIPFNPRNSSDLAQKIKDILENDVLGKQMIEKGTARLQEFSWKKAAEQVVSEFTKLVEK